MGRARASIAFVVGAALVFWGIALRFIPARSSAFEPRLSTGMLWLAIVFITFTLGLAWVVRPRRDAWVMLGALPLGGALGLVMPLLSLLEPIVRDHLLPAGLEASGGFLVIVAAVRAFHLNRMETGGPVRATRKKRVKLRGGKSEIEVESISPGDEIELQPGDDVPVDGTVVAGSGFVDEFKVTGPGLPAAKKPGDFLLAGSSSTIPDLVLRAGAVPSASLLAQREQLATDVADELSKAGMPGKLAAAIVTLLLVAGFGLILVRSDLRIIERWMPQATGLLLSSVAGASSIALMSARFAVFRLARKAGMIVARGKDVRNLASVRRWQIDPRLLSAPGAVEVVALADENSDRLLAVSEALIADELGPELPSLQAALRKKKIAPLAAAALRRVLAVYHGTVDGERWFLGPQRALEEEEKIEVDGSTASAIDFLRDKGLVTWLIGKQGEGLVGVIGIGIGAKPDAKSTAIKLKATLMPGLPDATRRIVATAAGIECDGPPLGRTDGTLLNETSPPPSTGLRIRVIHPSPGIELKSDRSPKILEASVAAFADLAIEAKRIGRRAAVRSAFVASVPIVLACGLFLLGPLSPLIGTGLALLTLLWANRS